MKNTLNTLVKLLLNNKNKQKISKQRVDYLLSALAISALSAQAQAEGSQKSYKIDVKQLAKEAGVKISDVNKVEVKLAEGGQGEVVNLGGGIFEVTLAEGVSSVNFIVSGSGVESVFTSSFSTTSISTLKQDFSNSWNEFIDSLTAESASSTQITADFDASALGLAVLAVAVSGGSSSSASVAAVIPEVLADISLVVSKGTLQNAQVFLDADNDGVLDWTDGNSNDAWDAGEGEQWALTDDTGAVSFSQVVATNLVAQAYKVGGVSQTVDAVSGSNVENLQMKADATASVITPLTTLVKAGLSNDDVLNILGLGDLVTAGVDINSYDPFSVANANSANSVAYEKIAAQTFTLINATAELVAASADGVTADTSFTYALSEIITQIEAKIVADPTTTIDLSDTAIITAIIDSTIAAVDVAKGTSVAENLAYNSSSITSSIATAIANTNAQIQTITTFDSAAKSILNNAADGVSAEIKVAVEAQVAVKVEVERLDAIITSGDETDQAVIDAKESKVTELATFEEVTKIAAAADVVKYISEDANTANSTFEITGTTSAGIVDAVGVYGNLTHSDGDNWVFTPHTSSNHGQALNDKQTYTETFVVTEGSNTYNVTVVLLGANDDAIITAANPDAITEGDTTTDVTATGTATHTDIDANNVDNVFTAVTAGTASTSDYGTYEVSTAGVWTYTLDSTNATVKALNTGSIAITDTITITAEDGTTESITITINGSNDAPTVSTVISDASTNEDAVYSYDTSANFTDVDTGDGATYTATLADDTALPSWLSITSAGVLSGTPLNADVGAIEVKVTRTDTASTSVSDTFTLTVNNVNDAPVGVADTASTHASLGMSEGAADVVLNLTGNDTDDENDTTSVIFVSDNDAGTAGNQTTQGGTVTLTSGVVTYTPTVDFYGTDTFTYIARDDNDNTSETSTTTVTLTVANVNDDPTGSVTITGDNKTGQTLTASNDLTDADGMGTVSYQWSKDGVDVAGATNTTLVLVDADIGSVFRVTASYTDDGNTVETSTSSATSAVVDIVKLVQIRNIETITEMDASILLYGSDGTGGSTENLIKFDVYLDAEGINSLSENSAATEIRGVEFDIDWTSLDLEEFGVSLVDSSSSILTGAYAATTDYIGTRDTSDTTINGATGKVVIVGDGTKIVNTDVSDDTVFTGNIQIDKKIATLYVNPEDAKQDISITLNNIIVDTDDGVVTPLSYSVDIL